MSWPLNSTSRNVFYKYTHKNETICPTFIVMLIIIEYWSQSEYPLIEKWLNKLQYIPTKEYYVAIK